MSTATQPPPTPDPMPPSIEDLIKALKVVLGKGLPITPARAPEPLLGLRGVWARAIAPDERTSRVKALNQVLVGVLRNLPEANRHATEALFGLGPTAGTNLTARREVAATLYDRDAEHFRRRIEPELIALVAWQLHSDSLNYVPRDRAAPLSPEISGDTPRLDPEQIETDEQAAHEELVSHIWEYVYGLRAALIALSRAQRDDPVDPAAIREARDTGTWQLARLLQAIDTYVERYGQRILHGESEYQVEALIRVAGLTGGISTEQAARLRLAIAQVPEWDRAGFSVTHDGISGSRGAQRTAERIEAGPEVLDLLGCGLDRTHHRDGHG